MHSDVLRYHIIVWYGMDELWGGLKLPVPCMLLLLTKQMSAGVEAHFTNGILLLTSVGIDFSPY